VNYPPILDPHLEALAAGMYWLLLLNQSCLLFLRFCYFFLFLIFHVIPVPELYAMCRYMTAGSGRVIGNSEPEGLINEKTDEKKKLSPEADKNSEESPKADGNTEERPQADENNKESSKIDESELRLAQLQHQLPANEPGALMHLVEESTADDADDEETKQCKSLFKNLKFYLSREVSYCPCRKAQNVFCWQIN
jgi:hypothetical protein